MRGTVAPDGAFELASAAIPDHTGATVAQLIAWWNTCGEAVNALTSALHSCRDWPSLAMGLSFCTVGNGGDPASHVATVGLGWVDQSPLARHPAFNAVCALVRSMNDAGEELHRRGVRISARVVDKRILPAKITR